MFLAIIPISEGNNMPVMTRPADKPAPTTNVGRARYQLSDYPNPMMTPTQNAVVQISLSDYAARASQLIRPSGCESEHFCAAR